MRCGCSRSPRRTKAEQPSFGRFRSAASRLAEFEVRQAVRRGRRSHLARPPAAPRPSPRSSAAQPPRPRDIPEQAAAGQLARPCMGGLLRAEVDGAEMLPGRMTCFVSTTTTATPPTSSALRHIATLRGATPRPPSARTDLPSQNITCVIVELLSHAPPVGWGSGRLRRSLLSSLWEAFILRGVGGARDAGTRAVCGAVPR